MTPHTLRLTKEARDQLMTLKRRTGIKNWNILCRWAVCRSLAEPSSPRELGHVGETGVEMTWDVFAGPLDSVLEALMRVRCDQDGLPVDSETLSTQLRLHVHRGISFLIGDPDVRDIKSLVGLAIRGDG